MTLCDLGNGFGLVPLAETDVAHVMHPRAQLARAFRGDSIPVRLPMRQCAYIASNCDVMAIQASVILRGVLEDLR